MCHRERLVKEWGWSSGLLRRARHLDDRCGWGYEGAAVLALFVET